MATAAGVRICGRIQQPRRQGGGRRAMTRSRLRTMRTAAAIRLHPGLRMGVGTTEGKSGGSGVDQACTGAS